MSKSRFIKLDAELQWAKVFTHNRDMIGYKPNDKVPGSYEDCDGAYKVDLILDEENLQKLTDAGSMKRPKEQEDGRYKVTVIRKHKGPFPEVSGPPKVTGIGDSEEIGNGSKAIVTVVCYDTSFGTVGTRLEEIKVTDLVEYERPTEPSDGVSDMPF